MKYKELAGKTSEKKNYPLTAPDFPVVAIGASAGGFNALESFFENMPDISGTAFVIIQHLDPNYKGMMPELIQRKTSMKVIQVTDRMILEPDRVYVIPPNKNMSIVRGRLLLIDLPAHGLRLPINFFFSSLADDMGERSIGIILSGMGSDGSIGMKAIKEKSGLTLVQDPEDAEYDSMPQNAIKSAMIDIIAPANELPGKLMSVIGPRFLLKKKQSSQDRSSLNKILSMIMLRTGHDFSMYKKSTIYRRLERRLLIHKLDGIASYVDYLRENPTEIEILFRELLIGVTGFFRDKEVWHFFRDTVLPSVFADKPDHYVLRIWVPGCSTGEEAYTIAIVIKEALEALKPAKNISCQIFASDIDIDAIGKARKGIFRKDIADSLEPERLTRFFSASGEAYQIVSEIREMVVFAAQNVINDPPFTKLDIISCRNLMIYHESELQRRLFSIFHYSLKPEGILLLGISETTGSQNHLFTTINTKFRIYQKLIHEKPGIIDIPATIKHHENTDNEITVPVKSINNIQSITDTMILQKYSPAGVLTDKNGDILYLTRRAGRYLEPAAGKANMNIFAMLREGLSIEFPIAFRKAMFSFDEVNLKNLKPDNGKNRVEVIIQQLREPEAVKGLFLIVFKDVADQMEVKTPAPGKWTRDAVIREQGLEVQRLKNELQHTIEVMQMSEEELKSSNEELQSTNEELQSTNEELTTSKEELQSMNEELQTVNLELMHKVDEMTNLSNDVKNLLESTEIAVLFLHKDLTIRRFTSGVGKLFHMIEIDLGRPISDLTSELIYESFMLDLREVLRTLVSLEKKVQSKSGIWFNIKVMPYRTIDDKIDGLVITFNDITASMKTEENLNKTIKDLRK